MERKDGNNMKNRMRKLGALCLLLAVLASVVPPAARAAGSAPVVKSYTVAPAGISKGQTAKLTVYLKDPGTTTKDAKDAKANSLDVSRLVDSFSEGTVSTPVITSAPGEPLEFYVVCSNLVYSGSGKSFRLMAGVDGAYTNLEFSVSQAVEYDGSKTEITPAPADTTPTINPAPLVQISRSSLSGPVTAGQEFTLTLNFRNLDTTPLRTPIASVTASDGLMLMDEVSSYAVGDVLGGKTGSVQVRLRAADTIASPAQSLSVELKFNYNNGSALVSGSASEKLNIPAKVRTKGTASAPTVIVTRSAVPGPVKPGQQVPVTVSFRNAGKTAIQNPVAVFSTTDSLTLLGSYSTYVLPDIPAGGSKSVTVQVKANKDVTATTQSVNVDLKYTYDAGDTTAAGTVSDKVNLAMEPTTSTGAPAPNLIISQFDYGGAPVNAGSKFPLKFTIRNTSSSMTVENIVATLDTGGSFAVDGGTNTYFYSKLGAGGEKTQSVAMQALAAQTGTAQTGGAAQGITVNFKYEYVDAGKRTQGTASVVLSVPVVLPNRFNIFAPTVPETVNAGEETTLSVSYVNKGKSEVSNVEAKIVAPDGTITAAAPVQNLGNFESGKSGAIGFAFTPLNPGALDVTLVVSYEDANAKVQTVQFPVHLTVVEPAPAATEDPSAKPAKKNKHLAAWIGGGAGVLAVLAAVLLRKRKKKKAAALAVDSGWEDWDDAEPGTTEPAQTAAASASKTDAPAKKE